MDMMPLCHLRNHDCKDDGFPVVNFQDLDDSLDSTNELVDNVAGSLYSNQSGSDNDNNNMNSLKHRASFASHDTDNDNENGHGGHRRMYFDEFFADNDNDIETQSMG